MTKKKSLYEKDFYQWSLEQSKLVRKKEFEKLDTKNIAEEIESLGRSEKRNLINNLKILFLDKLKSYFKKKEESKMYVLHAKIEVGHILEVNPSLKSKLNKIIDTAYEHSRELLQYEDGIDMAKVPEKCPMTKEEILKF